MTRINCVPVQELTNQHLVAEWKELRRIFTFAMRWYNNGRRTEIPPTYRMGAGHVTFFYDKLAYCYLRHLELLSEMRRRGFTANAKLVLDLEKIPDAMFNYWQPDEAAMAINRARIAERLKNVRITEKMIATAPETFNGESKVYYE